MNPVEQETIDEALGEQLERHLEAIRSGAPSAMQAGGDAELAALQPVVDRLYQLAQGLHSPTSSQAAGESTVDAPAASAETPARIGKFQILRVLGKGGQAATLLAFDPDLKRHVVLKLYHAARTPAEQEMVLHEGQALARVRSRYVASCYSAERHEGVPYLVVEYVPGKSLAELLTARRFAVSEALALIRQLAEGLAAVHACGLLHRDIKPGNILISDDGTPRLIDFGLAAPLASDALANRSGTLAFMAPEQARCQFERIDPRTDLYGLGAVLYCLLTGRPPHVAVGTNALLEAASNGDVTPPRQRQPDVPRAVNDLCMRCLAKDPAQRFASAAELGVAVRWLERPRQYWPIAVAAGLAAMAAVIAVVLLNRQPDEPSTEQPPPAIAAKNDGKKETISPVEKKPLPLPLPKYLQGRAPRQDFAFKVDVVGSTFDTENSIHVVHVGEIIAFKIEAAQNCYVGLWNVTPSKATQLFPNRNEPGNFFRQGSSRQVPGEPMPGERPKVIKATKPSESVEYIHVLASANPLRPIDAPALRAGPFDIYQTPESLERCTKAFRDFELVDAKDAVSEVVLRFQIRP